MCSWGLNLFVLFEQMKYRTVGGDCSWGLNLFVLFERVWNWVWRSSSSWGLNLFVLFELDWLFSVGTAVLEDWIYLYYLNANIPVRVCWVFLRIEFICIIWTVCFSILVFFQFLRIEFICIIWTLQKYDDETEGSWGLNLFVLFEQRQRKKSRRQVLEDWIYLYYLNDNTP